MRRGPQGRAGRLDGSAKVAGHGRECTEHHRSARLTQGQAGRFLDHPLRGTVQCGRACRTTRPAGARMPEREIRHAPHRDKPVDILPDGAVAAIKDATAEVLWRTGIQVRSESLLKQLGAAGAEIDTEDERARVPKDVQAGALESVPHDLPLRSREPGLDLILDGTRGYLGVDGNAAEVVDLDTDLRRASRKEDVAAGTLIGDALPQIGYVWQPAVSRERPFPSEPLHNLEANLNNTGKHIVMMTAVTPEQAVASAEMAAAPSAANTRFASSRSCRRSSAASRRSSTTADRSPRRSSSRRRTCRAASW